MSEAKTYRVVTAMGEVVDVEADQVDMDEAGVTVSLYAEGDLAGSFRGFNSIHVVNGQVAEEPEVPVED